MKSESIGTVIVIVVCLLLFNVVAATGATLDAETGYSVQPLLNDLKAMSAAEIDNNVNRYTDMDKHWSRQVVGKLTGLGIIAGYDGKFWPGNPVQVDQFIKMSVMAMGYKIEQGTDYWAQPYIDTALSEGLVEIGEFADYKRPLTREQMAKIIVKTLLKVEEKPDSQNEQYIMSKISDFMYIESEYKQYVLDGYKLGLIQGSGGKYHPQGTLTRAEAAAVIIRILDGTERKPTKPASEEDRFPWEINYPSDEELTNMYKNPAIPERLYTRLADTDEGQINILKSHHKFMCRSGVKEAEEWAAFAKSYIETLNNIDYRIDQTEFKSNMPKVLTSTGTFTYNGKSNLTMKSLIEEYVKDFTNNTIIQEARFITDPSLVYYGGHLGSYRVRGTLYFKFSEPSNPKWLWPGATVGEWHQMDMEMDFYYTLTRERGLDKEIYLEKSRILEDVIN